MNGTNGGELPRFKLRGHGAITTFIDNSCRHENLALPGRVTITVRGDGKTRRTHLNDQCDSDWHPQFTGARGWLLSGHAGLMHFIVYPRLGLGTHHFRGTIRFRKKLILTFTFTVTIALR